MEKETWTEPLIEDAVINRDNKKVTINTKSERRRTRKI